MAYFYSYPRRRAATLRTRLSALFTPRDHKWYVGNTFFTNESFKSNCENYCFPVTTDLKKRSNTFFTSEPFKSGGKSYCFLDVPDLEHRDFFCAILKPFKAVDDLLPYSIPYDGQPRLEPYCRVCLHSDPHTGTTIILFSLTNLSNPMAKVIISPSIQIWNIETFF